MIQFLHLIDQKEKFGKFRVDQQVSYIHIWHSSGNINDLIEFLVQTVLLFPMKTEYRHRAVKDREDLFVAGGAETDLLWKHKADDNSVAGRPWQIFGLVEDGGLQNYQVIGDQIIPFSFHKMISLGT